ncbi:MAG: hypothetical protein LBH09_01380, partial [Peptococcaceae bacterium]|nr:hypothetical protein [Peptococcaceae bacterium]
MNTKNRKQHKAVGLATKKNIAFVLVCLFVFTNWMGLPDLPGFPNLPDFPNLPSFLNPSRSGAAAYAAGDPGWEAGPGEILVFSQAEFKSAVEAPDPVLPARSLYHTIYLGADITFTTAAQTASFGNEANYSRGSLTIDGTNPKTGIVHTITSNFAVITRNGTVAQMPNNESYTFRNIKLRSSANANGFFSFGTAANSAKAKINFENADIVAYRTVFSNTLSNLSSQAKVEIMDSYIESTNNGDVSLIYCGNLILTGEVTINSMTRSVFRLGNSQKTWSLTVTEGADVRIANKNIDSSYSALFYSLALINAIDIGEGASFYYTGRQFARTDTSAVNTGYWINTLTVDKNAVLKLNLIGSNTGYNKLRAHNIVVNEGATLAAYALAGTTSTATNNTGTASAHPAVQADVLELNNPFRVTVGVGNPAATATGNWNALFQNSMTIKAKGIKSIRYYIDGGSQSFDSGGNYIGDRRTDYTRWWFQESGVFGFEVQNIGQMTPSVMSQSYDTAGNAAVAAEPKFEGPDVSAGPVRVVQIDGGSRSPTIDAVYVGASKVTGVGVPGAEVTITWPTMNQISATPVTTVTVAPDGTWQAFVPGDLFLDISSIFEESKIKAVQCEDVYGFSRGDSYPVFADVRGTTLKVLGNNMRNIYYNSGETPDVADVIFYGAGETVVLEEQAGRYLITNKAVPDMNDVSAFESMYTETGSMHKGYLAAETGVFFKQELRDIPANCTVWVMATLLYGGSENTIGDALTYTNLYERRDIYVRLVEGPLGAPVGGLYVIIPYTQLAGNYGIPYDLNGAVLTGPSARYSRANLEINSVFSDYWTASTKDGGDTPRTIVLDAGFPQSYIALSDDAEGLRYTLYLEKIMLPDPRWVQVPVRYVDCVGNAIDTGEPAAIDHIWVPLDLTEQEDDRPDPPEGEELEPLPPIIESSCSAFLERGGYFIPGKYFPYSPVGYYTSNTGAIDVREDEGDPLKMTACTDFAKEFEPRMEDIAHIPQEILYIVYDQGYISVREIHETEAGAPIHDERKTSVKIEEGKEPPRYTAPRVTGYVPVGYKVNNLNGAYEDRFIYSPAPGYPPSMDQNGLIYVDITQSMIMTGFVGDAEEIEIVWIYAPDADGLGIPDDCKVRVIVQWHGQIVNNPFPAILKDTQYITTRKGFGITFTNDGSEQGNPEDRIVINFGVYEGAWMFDKENPSNAAIREIVPTEREEVIFYYAYSSDGIEPDNRQYVDINRITWDDNLGDNESAPPEPVGKAYVLHGQRFSHMPGELEGYVYYGYRLDNDQDVQVTYENGVSHKAIEFHTSENNHTVTLVYIKKGGAVTVIWEGETSAGNTVILYRKEYAGYVGEQVVVDQNSVLLADVWLFETGQPLTHVFTLGNFPQEEKFMYRESEPDDDFIYVTVKGVEGATVHYSYVKRIAKSGLPAVLTSPADVFDIPGYKLDEASDFVVTESTREKIFNYASLATTVAIKMVDSGGADVAAHFTVSAVAGQPFSYYAPDVPGHFLTGSASGSVSEVREDGASEIVFTYAQVNSKVTIIAKENDTDGKV